MTESDNLRSFFNENKKRVEEYFETRSEIYRLRLIRILALAAGRVAWLVISMVLVALLIIFLGLVTGFWLSEVTGTYTRGFALTALIILTIILLLASLRKLLFVSPLVRFIIRKTNRETGKEKNDPNDIP